MHWCEWFKNRSCKGCFVKEANRLSHPSARPAFKQTMFGTLNALSCCSTSCHFWRQVPHFTTETAVWQHAGYGAKPNAGNMKQYNIKNQYLKQRQCRSIPNNSLSTCIYQINSMISVYIDTFKKNKFIYIYTYIYIWHIYRLQTNIYTFLFWQLDCWFFPLHPRMLKAMLSQKPSTSRPKHCNSCHWWPGPEYVGRSGGLEMILIKQHILYT